MSQYNKTIIKPENSNQPNIIIYSNMAGDRKMQFDVENDIKNNVFQSSYNINDLDIFNLTYLNFMILLFEYVENPKSFLFIGLGGGHLPMFVNKKIIDNSIDVVELNKQVLEGAIQLGYNINNVIIDDGNNYINQTTKTYDVIIIDLDEEFSYKNFNFDRIFKILNDNGILAINSYAVSGKSYIKNRIKKSFPLIKHFVYGNSNVYLCKKNIDQLENMLEKITISKIEQNNILKMFKYKENLIDSIKKSKISITLN